MTPSNTLASSITRAATRAPRTSIRCSAETSRSITYWNRSQLSQASQTKTIRPTRPCLVSLTGRSADVASTRVSTSGGQVACFTTVTPRQDKVVKPFLLADIGEGIAEVEIVKWLVKPDAIVEEFDPIAEVQSDKATVELTSPYAGKIIGLFGGVGETVKVGSKLFDIEMEAEDTSDEAASAPPEASPSVSQPASSSPPPPQEVSATAVADSAREGVHSTPAVRRLSKEHNLNINTVDGTGKDGRVTKEDVLNHLSSKPSTSSSKISPFASSASATVAGEIQRIPFSAVRSAMYRSMTSSLQLPHFGYSDELDVTELERFRQSLNSDVPLRFRKILSPAQEDQLEASGTSRVEEDGRIERVTILSLLVKAMGFAMLEHPIFRSTLARDSHEFLQRESCDISIALSTPAGLFTPLIPSVEQKSVFEVASWITKLQNAAKSGSKTSAPKFPSLAGKAGTITLSNVGVIGGTYTHPVIPPTGQLAIGALGRLQTLPRFLPSSLPAAKAYAISPSSTLPNFAIEPRLIFNTSFTADHRAVEGTQLAGLVQRWKELVEEPGKMIGLGK